MLRTMPRMLGVSSRSTTELSFRSPSARTVALWLDGRPITDLFRVIFSLLAIALAPHSRGSSAETTLHRLLWRGHPTRS